MKLNNDCIRDVLTYLIENLTISIDEMHAQFDKVCVRTVMKDLNSKFSNEDIWYSIFILSEIRYISTTEGMITSHLTAHQEVINVTYSGHQFYELTKPENVWEKTQGIIKKVGGGTLEFVKEVAHDVAVESAKTAVAASFGQPPQVSFPNTPQQIIQPGNKNSAC